MPLSDIYLTGWAHSRFGRLEDRSLEDLVVEVTRGAIEDAAIDPGDIDEIFFGNFNAGMVPLAFPSSLALQAFPALGLKPATRVENACASGSAAFHAGVRSLLAGTARHVLVIGGEKMTHASPEIVGRALLGADYDTAGTESTTGFTGLFADVADVYQQRYGDISDPLGLIAAKNHRNGVANPFAHIRKDLGAEFCQTVSDRNPIVAGMLRRTDCSPVSDGAAALILSRDTVEGSAHPAVRVLSVAHANDFLPGSRRDALAFAGSAAAWNQALVSAGIVVDDLDFVEVHDCFTIAELIMYEVMGLAPRGDGRRAIEEGHVLPGGRLPVNVSGGLKAKGHPVGATGVSQHVLAAMQLSGTAGEMQLSAPRRAAVHNMGGLAVANYVSVLEAQ